MSTIQEYLARIKVWGNRALDEWAAAVLVVVIGLGGFMLGRISAQESHNLPIVIETPVLSTGVGEMGSRKVQAAAVSLPLNEEGGQLVASKNGSSYHLPWCAGAKSISDKNKIYFSSEEEAKAAGYKPAKNCKGLGGN